MKKLRPQEDSNVSKCERGKSGGPQKTTLNPAGEEASRPDKKGIILAEVFPSSSAMGSWTWRPTL